MQIPYGEFVEGPAESAVADEMVRMLSRPLNILSQRAASLYLRSVSVADNFYHYDNFAKPVTFLEDYDPATPKGSGVMRFTVGTGVLNTDPLHDLLFITMGEDKHISLRRDHYIRSNDRTADSHLIEIDAEPIESQRGYEYGEFALNIFKRGWRGWPQGISVPDEDIDDKRAVSKHLKDLSRAMRRAEDTTDKIHSKLAR
jgi:hypothetical protein